MRRGWTVVVAVMLAITVRPAGAAKDDLRGLQWGLDQVRGPKAWTVTQGAGAVVAVVDTGVDLEHPDLAGRLLTGRDFVDPGTPPRDEHGHGTLVAGIIAANANNSIGIAGVAPLASILPVRALDAEGRGDPGVVADAIAWSVERGSDVINLSLSVVPSGTLVAQIFSDRRVEDAISAAAQANVLVVIASGNDPDGGQPETSYEASDEGVLVVGASTRERTRAAYSNYGDGLHLVAPGGGTDREAGAKDCTQRNAIVSTWWTEQAGSVYGATCGTSMATAFVSGIGALLASKGLDSRRAARRMLSTARDLDPPGHDPHTGRGLVDAARSVGAFGSSAPAGAPAGSTPSAPPPSVPAPARSVEPAGEVPVRTPTPVPEPQDRHPVVDVVPPQQPLIALGARSPIPIALASVLAAIAVAALFVVRRRLAGVAH